MGTQTQYKLQQEILKSTGINIVTCGNCACTILHKTPVDAITCHECGYKSDICDFPDLKTVLFYEKNQTKN